MPGWFHFSMTRRLIQRALDFQPDVIHCFKPKAYAGLSAWQLWHMQRLGRVKARLLIDTDDWEGAGGWNDFSNLPSAVNREYSWAQKKMFAWQEQWGLTHHDGVTVASKACIDHLVAGRGRRRRVCPNGVVNGELRSQNLDNGILANILLRAS
jgi:hypothetical protein